MNQAYSMFFWIGPQIVMVTASFTMLTSLDTFRTILPGFSDAAWYEGVFRFIFLTASLAVAALVNFSMYIIWRLMFRPWDPKFGQTQWFKDCCIRPCTHVSINEWDQVYSLYVALFIFSYEFGRDIVKGVFGRLAKRLAGLVLDLFSRS